jgi:hypothetical protein
VFFCNFETSPRCHGDKKFKIEHDVTEVMVQSTYLSSFISIEGFFDSFIAVGTGKRRLFNEIGHFSQYSHGVKG